MKKYRGTLYDQVNPSSSGAPFFTIQTLNPIWDLNPKSPIVTIPPFQLTNQDGDRRDEALFADKISIVGFMFASCQGFCPFLIEGMKAIDHDLANQKNLQFVALSVNPDEDTPERLRTYANDHHLETKTRWTLLTGSKSTIYDLAKKTFMSEAFRRPTKDANFVHSEHLYVIDGRGRLRGILNGTRVDIKTLARRLMNQLSKSPVL